MASKYSPKSGCFVECEPQRQAFHGEANPLTKQSKAGAGFEIVALKKIHKNFRNRLVKYNRPKIHDFRRDLNDAETLRGKDEPQDSEKAHEKNWLEYPARSPTRTRESRRRSSPARHSRTNSTTYSSLEGQEIFFWPTSLTY